MIKQIETINLVKSFSTSKDNTLTILNEVSISLYQNKINIIFGPSGAGKSTLLHLLSGLDTPTSGDVFYYGLDIYNKSKPEKTIKLNELSQRSIAKFRNKVIGFVFQFHHLLPEFTAYENIFIPQIIYSANYSKARKRTLELLDLMGLRDRAAHKPAELSGGEQQRVALARALSNDPSIIFADEPTGNLDSKNSLLLNNLFVKLRDEFNKTLVIVTHNKELISLGDSLYEIKDGQATNIIQ